jgi:glycosyltransferase involved in cell wall biosynthesis
MHEGLISVVVPVNRVIEDFPDLVESYREALARTGRDFEFLFVLEGAQPEARAYLQGLQEKGHPIRLFQLTKSFGEAAALCVGFDHARGDVLMTLPSTFQVEASSLPKLLEALHDNDMVVVRRWPRRDSRFSRLKTAVFNRLVFFRSRIRFHDLGCSVRILRKAVANEVPLYGDQEIFFPMLATQKGFAVQEIDLPQAQRAPYTRHHRSGVYLRRLLDVATVWFLTKFMRKPLRFFGMVGTPIAALGFLLLLVVIVERLFFGVGLADRPALLLASLMVVLGVQIVVMGLIGELVIFTHARDLKEYEVREILTGQAESVAPGGSRSDSECRNSVTVSD